MNSTVGLVGLFDVAEPLTGMEPDPEDFGQTLAVWGLPFGPLIEMPLTGPQSLREFGGGFVDSAFSVATFTPGAAAIGLRSMRYGARAERRAKLDDLLDVTFALDAEDSYLETRCLYMRRRIYRVLDGKLPPRKHHHEDAEPVAELVEAPAPSPGVE